jgi:hypothetical protein
MADDLWQANENQINIRKTGLQVQAERFGLPDTEEVQQFIDHVAEVMATIDAECQFMRECLNRSLKGESHE